MNPVTSKRPKTLKSRIPVLVTKVKSSNPTCKENKICEKSSLVQTSSTNKAAAKKVVVKKSNLHAGKAPSEKACKENVIIKSSSVVQTSSTNKTAAKKVVVKKSNSHAGNAPPEKTCKENIIVKPSSISQISNSNKTAIKSSHPVRKELVEISSSQVEKTLTDKTHKQNIISIKASSISHISNAKKTASKNPHLVQKDVVEESNSSLVEKALTDRNTKKSKLKLASSKDNAQTAVKININSKQNKNKELLTCKIISEKENQETMKNNFFSAQKDIKFEGNELFRKMILSEKGLSPSICKLMPNLKLSSVQTERPSIYQKFELHPDPAQQAIEAIANASAHRSKRIVSIQKDKKTSVILSPFKERNSFYTPCADPKEEVMRSLKYFKERQMQKSTKGKVTFNLTVEEYTAKIDYDTELVPSKNSEDRLTKINEGSEENTPNSPVRSTCSIQLDDRKQPSEFQKASVQIKAANQTGDLAEFLCSPISERSAEICTPVSTIVPKDVESKPIENVGLSFYSLKKTDPVSSHPGFVCGNTRPFHRILNSQKNVTDQNVNRTSHAKLYTPRPVSFYSNSRLLNDSPSPEFLIERNSKTLSNLPPIYTPLALKNIAKSSAISPDAGLSPVRLKLDFTLTEKDTPQKETFVKNPTSVTLEKILTVQKKLDDLADQECSFLLLNESIPVVCGRYLQNPIAVTLTEGDEMHFMPIRL